jgi:hypothetical protein
MPPSPLARLRKICLKLPETTEVEAWGAPTFRVKGKIFAMYAKPEGHAGGGRAGLWCAAAQVDQDLLISSDPERFFKPPYVGVKGWVGVYIDRSPDWDAVTYIVRAAWRRTAPKKLLAMVPAD